MFIKRVLYLLISTLVVLDRITAESVKGDSKEIVDLQICEENFEHQRPFDAYTKSIAIQNNGCKSEIKHPKSSVYLISDVHSLDKHGKRVFGKRSLETLRENFSPGDIVFIENSYREKSLRQFRDTYENKGVLRKNPQYDHLSEYGRVLQYGMLDKTGRELEGLDKAFSWDLPYKNNKKYSVPIISKTGPNSNLDEIKDYYLQFMREKIFYKERDKHAKSIIEFLNKNNIKAHFIMGFQHVYYLSNIAKVDATVSKRSSIDDPFEENYLKQNSGVTDLNQINPLEKPEKDLKYTESFLRNVLGDEKFKQLKDEVNNKLNEDREVLSTLSNKQLDAMKKQIEKQFPKPKEFSLKR